MGQRGGCGCGAVGGARLPSCAARHRTSEHPSPPPLSTSTSKGRCSVGPRASRMLHCAGSAILLLVPGSNGDARCTWPPLDTSGASMYCTRPTNGQ
ncbi:hypothetical protein FA09DRAFT_330273 [Tilletiopsis washingtonensis]|uniref:Uncharacterized protein n=1 Tax=Tilletiopsis washingtonensis TaxID=58919 RepID=A0A316Z9G8_9BASI|nr:hypothetical protein FA09DRAFT_330273 [Tilletiopsis washingtonensis]PWN97592.1 hypothetical protein FA09DRAFT_330273 [Tilletiopsis washingtonensis]